MRRSFAKTLLEHARTNKKIHLLVGDLGYGMFDEFRDTLPKQFFNCGASEQVMLDMAVGMAYSDKIPVVYTITPFYYRAFETIRTYIVHEQLHVIMAGSGRDRDYDHDGYSHHAIDVPAVFRAIGLDSKYPVLPSEIPYAVQEMIETPMPWFISLRR